MAQFISQLQGTGIGEIHRSEIGQIHNLLHNGLCQVFSSVTDMNRSCDAGDKIQVRPAFIVKDGAALSFGDDRDAFFYHLFRRPAQNK